MKRLYQLRLALKAGYPFFAAASLMADRSWEGVTPYPLSASVTILSSRYFCMAPLNKNGRPAALFCVRKSRAKYRRRMVVSDTLNRRATDGRDPGALSMSAKALSQSFLLIRIVPDRAAGATCTARDGRRAGTLFDGRNE